MANTPKIRFESFTEDWKQRKVKNIAPLQRGFDLPTSRMEEGVYPVVMSNGIGGHHSQYKVKGPGIVTGRSGTIGKLHYIEDDYWPHNTTLWVTDFYGNNQKFIYYMYQCLDLTRFSTGSGVPTLNRNDVHDEVVCIPSVSEQNKISEYLTNLDYLITLHQRKCEETKEVKKYMMQKMFPRNGQKNPEIRFAGFTDDWEQRKFSDFTWASGKRNKEDLDLEPYAITNEYGFIPQNKAHDEFGYMKDTDRKVYNIVTPNSFAYNPARINVGSIGYYEGTENVIVSSLYEVFQTTDYVDDRFLWHWFKSDEFPKWIERFQEGSVRLYFYYDKLCECQILMPSVAEQKKIATSLDRLDCLITLHLRKCDALKEVKKFMLQNMFP